MVCPCCRTVACADKCSGNGVPSQLSIQLSGVTFGANSELTENDLPFSVPVTFLLPLTDPDSGCRIWSDSFFPRQSFCRPCGEGGFGSLAGLGITVGRPVGSDVVNVSIIMAFGEPNFFGNCLGVSSRLQLFSAVDICTLPFTGTASNANYECAATNISTVEFTLEAA